MKIVEINGSKYLDNDTFKKLRLLFNQDNTTKIKKNSKIYFTKNTNFNSYLLGNASQDLTFVRKLVEADFVVYKPIFLDSNHLLFTDNKRIVEDYEIDDAIHDIVFPLSELDNKEIKTLEAIIESFNSKNKPKLVTEINLRKISNNNVVIGQDNLEYVEELFDSKDENNIKIGTELVSSCDIIKSKPYLCYLCIGYKTIREIPVIKEFLESEFAMEMSLITKDHLYSVAMLDQYVSDMIKNNILKSINTFLRSNHGMLNYPDNIKVSVLNIQCKEIT